MRAREGGHDESGFRVATGRTGAWISVGCALSYLLYDLLTWDAPHRTPGAALVASVPPLSVALAVWPPRRLIAGRLRELFFLSWSASLTLVIWVAAALD